MSGNIQNKKEINLYKSCNIWTAPRLTENPSSRYATQSAALPLYSVWGKSCCCTLVGEIGEEQEQSKSP